MKFEICGNEYHISTLEGFIHCMRNVVVSSKSSYSDLSKSIHWNFQKAHSFFISKNNIYRAELCVICQESMNFNQFISFYPCSHSIVCSNLQCYQSYQTCPLCRLDIQYDSQKFFNIRLDLYLYMLKKQDCVDFIPRYAWFESRFFLEALNYSESLIYFLPNKFWKKWGDMDYLINMIDHRCFPNLLDVLVRRREKIVLKHKCWCSSDFVCRLFYKYPMYYRILDLLREKYYKEYKKVANIWWKNRNIVSILIIRSDPKASYYDNLKTIISKLSIWTDVRFVVDLCQISYVNKSIYFFPLELWSKYETLSTQVVKKGNRSSINLIPRQQWTTELRLTLLKRDIYMIRCFSSDDVTKEMVLLILKQKDHRLAQCIPRRFYTVMAEDIIRFNVNFIKEFEEKYITRGIALVVLKHGDEDLVKYIPKSFFCDKQFCQTIAEKCSENFKYVEETVYDSFMVHTAIRKYPANIQYIPFKFRSYINCLYAVRSDGHLIHYVPQDKLNDDIMILALQNDSELILPLKYITPTVKDFLNKMIL